MVEMDPKLEEYSFPSIDLITDGLYLGDYFTGCNHHDTLRQHKITHIVSMNVNLSPRPPEPEFTHKFITEIIDKENEPIIAYFAEVTEYIHQIITEQQGRVFIHCFGGKSRAASIVIAYLIRYQQMSYQETLAETQDKRPIVMPNRHFKMQLKDWDEICKATYQAGSNNSIISPQGLNKNMALMKNLPTLENDTDQADLCCAKCQTRLFGRDLIVNNQKKHAGSNIQCSFYFVKKPEWFMDEDLGNAQVLKCPQCEHILGYYSPLGLTCCCEKKIKPGFFIGKLRVNS